MKYWGVTLTKDIKDFYTKNDKTSLNEITEDTNKWKDICVHGLEELILLKCPYYPKQSTESILIKIQMAFFFTEIKNIYISYGTTEGTK